jgi:hypothetical protein
VTAVEVAEEDGGETVVDVDVDGVFVLGLLEQAGKKTKVATSTTETTAADRRGREVRMRTILWHCGC